MDGSWDQAKDVLIENKVKFQKGLFHYNLGTVLYKQEQFAAARYHFEKALLNGFYQNESIHNLFVVKKKIQAETYEKPVTYEGHFYLSVLSYPTSFFVSLTLLFILATVLAKKHISRYVLVFLLFISLFPIGIKSYTDTFHHKAVTLSEISVYEGPSGIFSESSSLPAGIKVILGKQKDGWIYIKYPLQFSGWVKREKLGIL